MSQISFVRVVVGDAKKYIPGDQYSTSRKGEVELHSTIDADEDPQKILDHVRLTAQSEVNKILLGVSPAKSATDVKLVGSPSPPVAGAASVAASEPQARKRGRKPGSKNKNKAPTSAASVTEEPASSEPEVAPETEATPEITDKDLTDAATRKAGELKDPPRVRKVASEYVDYDDRVAKVRDIPQAKRQAYLDVLAALK